MEVDVYFDKQPQRPYHMLARIEAEQVTGGSQSGTFDGLRATAAKLGCEGLVVTSLQPARTSHSLHVLGAIGPIATESVRVHYVGKCIAFDDDPSALKL